jgi:hypothetical protein
VSGGFGTVAFVIGSEEEARLIAAAPDLLAALKGWRDWYADDDSSVTQATDLMPQTRAAIAKAEGES